MTQAMFYQVENSKFRLRAVDTKDEVECRVVSVNQFVVGAANQTGKKENLKSFQFKNKNILTKKMFKVRYFQQQHKKDFSSSRQLFIKIVVIEKFTFHPPKNCKRCRPSWRPTGTSL
jgi:D-Tyr-tRNAtyr deacylase